MLPGRFHINWLPSQKQHLFENNADHWKTWVHARLTCPVTSPGSIAFYQAHPHDHLALAKHLTAEAKVEEFVAGKGTIIKWERRRKQNHFFDGLYNTCVAASYVGMRLVQEIQKPKPPPKQQQPQQRRRLYRGQWIDMDRFLEMRNRYS